MSAVTLALTQEGCASAFVVVLDLHEARDTALTSVVRIASAARTPQRQATSPESATTGGDTAVDDDRARDAT